MIFVQVLVFLAIFATAATFAWGEDTAAPSGANWDAAARGLGQKVLARLAANETARIAWKDAAPAPAKTAFANALRRRVRAPQPIDVRVSVSQNIRGLLLIAEVVRADGNLVELIEVENEVAAPAKFSLKLTPLWQQSTRMLDAIGGVTSVDVLDETGLVSYQRVDGDWRRKNADPQTRPAPMRDLRGYISVGIDAVNSLTPGKGCVITHIEILCSNRGNIKEGGNTIQDGKLPPYFTSALYDNMYVSAEPDGRIHVYDRDAKPLGIFDGWGSDLANVSSLCSGVLLLVTPTDSSLALARLNQLKPEIVGAPLQLSGEVTALWSHPTSATVIVKNKSTGGYEALSVTIDCGN